MKKDFSKMPALFLLIFLLATPAFAFAGEIKGIASFVLGSTPDEVATAARSAGLTLGERAGNGENTTLHSFKGKVFGLDSFSISCFYEKGKLSDVNIDFNPKTAEDAALLKSKFTELKAEFDQLYGAKSGTTFKEDNMNWVTWDVGGRKTGFGYADDYSGANAFARVKLGNK